jgi:MarR family 2-MHQ and catechol resistance regulon transcriptional repressor
VSKHNEIARMLKVLPKMMKYLKGSFMPEMEKVYKKNELITLMEILNNPCKPMKYYVSQVGIENSSFTYIVDKLEKKGLVIRKANENDKRKTVLELTEKGKDITEDLRLQFESHISQRISCLDHKDLLQLEQATLTLEIILNKLEDSQNTR